MIMNLSDQIRSSFKTANALTRLIYINIAVFVVIKILSVVFFLMNRRELDQVMLGFFALPAETSALLQRPWTLLSYMFLHYDFLHILFNFWIFWGSIQKPKIPFKPSGSFMSIFC